MKELYEVARDLGIRFLKIIKNPSIYQAVMFDIDDTLIYSENSEPIKPIIELLNFALSKNYLVIIITARDEMYRQQTIRQLNDLNIRYTRLHMRPSNNFNISFKSDIKENYFTGYSIPFVMSVGDKNMDIMGRWSGYYLKLPEPNDPRLYHLNMNTYTKENVVP
jgi:predicted HAD superfamily phosphohydrolase YqeG